MNNVFLEKGKILYEADVQPQVYCFKCNAYSKKKMIQQIDLPSVSQGGVCETKRLLGTSKFQCFAVHFNSLNLIHQLMHFYIRGASRK